MLGFVVCAVMASGAAVRRSRPDVSDLLDKTDEASRKAQRMEKYDRLLEMAEKSKADVPGLREAVMDLKAREQAILDKDDVLRPPRAPRLSFGDEEEEVPDFFQHIEATPKMDKAEREEMMRKSRQRLDKLRDLDHTERIAEMRRERDDRLKDPQAAKLWRSQAAADYGPPKTGLGLAGLSPEERHAKLQEHQKLMEDHRLQMDDWREKHDAYMSERRAIMDSYRDLSHQIREAVFASRPLR